MKEGKRGGRRTFFIIKKKKDSFFILYQASNEISLTAVNEGHLYKKYDRECSQRSKRTNKNRNLRMLLNK